MGEKNYVAHKFDLTRYYKKILLWKFNCLKDSCQSTDWENLVEQNMDGKTVFIVTGQYDFLCSQDEYSRKSKF